MRAFDILNVLLRVGDRAVDRVKSPFLTIAGDFWRVNMGEAEFSDNSVDGSLLEILSRSCTISLKRIVFQHNVAGAALIIAAPDSSPEVNGTFTVHSDSVLLCGRV